MRYKSGFKKHRIQIQIKSVNIIALFIDFFLYMHVFLEILHNCLCIFAVFHLRAKIVFNTLIFFSNFFRCEKSNTD